MSYYNVKAISNSSLTYLCEDQGGSRLKFKKRYIDGDLEQEVTPSLENGKIIHAYIESPDDFVIADIDKPSGMMAEFVEAIYASHGFGDINDTIVKAHKESGLYSSIKKENTIISKFEKEGKAYYDYLIMTQRVSPENILTSKQKEILENVIDSLNRNVWAKQELFGDNCDKRLKEYEMYSSYRDMPIKGMADIIDIDNVAGIITIKDFKTTSKPIAKYPEAFEYWHTYRQLAFYKRLFIDLHPEYSNYDFIFKVIAVETTGNYESRVFDISDEYIDKGEWEYTAMLDDIKLLQDHGWPDGMLYTKDLLVPNE